MSATDQTTKLRWLNSALILITILAATWLRLWRLPELPPGFYYDEAYNAMDGLWMRTSLTPQAYFVGNTSRHAMMPYLIALTTSIWGVTPLAARLVAPLVGVLTAALVYRLALTLFANRPDRPWLALLSAAGLAFSFWHVVMSRTAYEATLVPPFIVLTGILFWRGWQRRSLWYFAGAGLVLGLTQYTYVSGRLAPLIFGSFALLWTCIAIFSKKGAPGRKLRNLWLGLAVMALASVIPFVPLGLFILNDLGAFSFRSSDVFIVNRVAQGQASVADQLITALRVFIDSYSNTWRHSIVGQGGFYWINIVGFGAGLVTASWRFRRPAYILLLIALFVMWLPAPLSSGISTLRLSGRPGIAG